MLCIRFDSLPVASVSMVGKADGVPLVDGDGCVVVVLLVVLGSVKCGIYVHTHRVAILQRYWMLCTTYVCTRFASLPVLIVLVSVVDRVPLVTSGDPVLVGVWSCVTVLVGVVDGVSLVDSGDPVLVGVWPCVTVVVDVVDGVSLVTSGDPVLVGV